MEEEITVGKNHHNKENQVEMEEEITVGNNCHKENQDEMVNSTEKEKVVNTLIPQQLVRNVRLVKIGKSQVSNVKRLVSAKNKR